MVFDWKGKCSNRDEPLGKVPWSQMLSFKTRCVQTIEKYIIVHTNGLLTKSAMMPALKAAFILGKEAVLWFWNLMNIHHLYCPLLFSFTKQNNTPTNKAQSIIQKEQQTMKGIVVVLLLLIIQQYILKSKTRPFWASW